MTEPQKTEESLTSDFRELGQSLMDVLRAAWERPERAQLQQEIEAGLDELGRALKQASDEVVESPAGQRVKSEVEGFRGRVETSGVENTLRNDLQRALRRANEELGNLSGKMRVTPPESAPDGDAADVDAADADAAGEEEA